MNMMNWELRKSGVKISNIWVNWIYTFCFSSNSFYCIMYVLNKMNDVKMFVFCSRNHQDKVECLSSRGLERSLSCMRILDGKLHLEGKPLHLNPTAQGVEKSPSGRSRCSMRARLPGVLHQEMAHQRGIFRSTCVIVAGDLSHRGLAHLTQEGL